MSISRRLRYEILRRDEFRCRYCGATSADTRLTVDHVIPEALGGPTEPSNLVTACADCNSGKTSSAPDAAIVDDVAADAARWARAIRQVAAEEEAREQRLDAIIADFDERWEDWHYGTMKSSVPRPAAWSESVRTFLVSGLDFDTLVRLMTGAMGADRIAPDQTWRYFCGMCWRTIRRRQEEAAERLRLEDEASKAEAEQREQTRQGIQGIRDRLDELEGEENTAE